MPDERVGLPARVCAWVPRHDLSRLPSGPYRARLLSEGCDERRHSMTRRRPNRATVARLLAAHLRSVVLTVPVLTEDVDGLPLGVDTETYTGTFSAPSLQALGWTEAEWNDPSITE